MPCGSGSARLMRATSQSLRPLSRRCATHSKNRAIADGWQSRSVVANSADEIAQLRQIAQALRDAIESLHHEHRQEIQRLTAAAQDEAVQLQAAAPSLREQLEEAAFQTQVQKQEAAAAAAGEIQELKATCQTLRHELDRARGNVQ